MNARRVRRTRLIRGIGFVVANNGRTLSTLAIGVALAALTAFAADQGPTNTASHNLLLTDSLGRTVKVPTNEVPQGFQPPAATGLQHQFASTTPGVRTSDEVLRRTEEAHEGLAGIQFFPAVPPRLPSYLFGLDEYGNTLLAPGALIDFAPFEPPLQGGKYWLSEHGLRYSLEQTLTYVNMSDVIKGANILGYYTLERLCRQRSREVHQLGAHPQHGVAVGGLQLWREPAVAAPRRMVCYARRFRWPH